MNIIDSKKQELYSDLPEKGILPTIDSLKRLLFADSEKYRILIIIESHYREILKQQLHGVLEHSKIQLEENVTRKKLIDFIHGLTYEDVIMIEPSKTESGKTIIKTDSRYGAVTDDRDGRIYKTVRIGDSIWLAENLKYDTKNENCCYYNDNSEHFSKHGFLYNSHGARIACPKGWRLPTNKDWGKVYQMLDLSEKPNKEARRSFYIALMDGGQSGLDLLLSGSGDGDGNFSGMGVNGYYWESGMIGYAIKIFMDSLEYIHGAPGGKGFYSCRCVKEQ